MPDPYARYTMDGDRVLVLTRADARRVWLADRLALFRWLLGLARRG